MCPREGTGGRGRYTVCMLHKGESVAWVRTVPPEEPCGHFFYFRAHAQPRKEAGPLTANLGDICRLASVGAQLHGRGRFYRRKAVRSAKPQGPDWSWTKGALPLPPLLGALAEQMGDEDPASQPWLVGSSAEASAFASSHAPPSSPDGWRPSVDSAPSGCEWGPGLSPSAARHGGAGGRTPSVLQLVRSQN